MIEINKSLDKLVFETFFKDICDEKEIDTNILNEAHKKTIALRRFELVSCCMSYLAINNYKLKNQYSHSLNLLKDAKYLAHSSKSLIAQKVNLFCYGILEYFEKNYPASLKLINASLCTKTEGFDEIYEIDEAINQYKQKIEMADYKDSQQLIEEQKFLFSSFIKTLSASIDARDKITSGHSKRVTMYVSLICDRLNLKDSEKETIKNASLLHDIGKIGIKDSVLQKEGKLTNQEYEHIKEHVRYTHNILKNVYSTKKFQQLVEIASSHHERYDGQGYYKGLKGNKIPFGGRIIAICDVFDAVTSKRHYRNKMEIKDALDIMVEGRNTHFDKNLCDIFLRISAFDILKIINSDINCDFSEDKNILKRFNLEQLYGILNSEEGSISQNDKNLIDTFDKYYHYTCAQ